MICSKYQHPCEENATQCAACGAPLEMPQAEPAVVSLAATAAVLSVVMLFVGDVVAMRMTLAYAALNILFGLLLVKFRKQMKTLV